MTRMMTRILNIVIYYIAIIATLGWSWNDHGCYHGIIIIAAIVATMVAAMVTVMTYWNLALLSPIAYI